MQVRANGLSFEVEEHGDPTGPPLLLIPGLGSQLIYWPDDWVSGFARAGYRVVLMDNRDCGLSEKLDHAGVPDIAALRAAPTIGAGDVPYTIDDMAADAAGILDALGIPAAHVIGRSMGGFILQSLIDRHPERVLSAVILISSSGAPDLSPMTPEVQAELFAPLSSAPADRDAVVDANLAADAAWASPNYPFDPAARRAFHARAYDRCHAPEGTARQRAAVLQGLGRQDRLAHFDLPTLVVQGGADTIFPADHGQDLARRIRNAALLTVDGMGHDIEGSAQDLILREILDFIERARG